jgi:uncharacterized protein YceK
LDDGEPQIVPDIRGRPVVLISIRATNLDGCAVSVSARVAANGARPEVRGGTLLDLTEQRGWGVPDAANPLHFASLPVEPGGSYDLVVAAEDADRRWAAVRHVISPR